METRPNVQSNRKVLHGMGHKEASRRGSMSKVRSPLLGAIDGMPSDPTVGRKLGTNTRRREVAFLRVGDATALVNVT